MREGGIEVQGLKELDEKLKGLNNELAGKALYSALNVALTPVVKEARARALKAEKEHVLKTYGGRKVKIQPGLLKEAIRKKRLPKREHTGEFENGAVMGIYIGKGKTQKEFPRYWHFIEHGTPTQSATPFLAPAFDSNIQTMTDRFKAKLAENIDKYTSEVGE